MVRAFLAVTVLLVGATAAGAQPAVFSTYVTGRLGVASQGDVREGVLMPSAAMAVLDPNGLGVEIDLGHGGDFDDSQFEDSSLTTVMLNVLLLYPHPRIRPFVAAGVGVMRVRVSFPGGAADVGQTDTAWSVGGGGLYTLSDALSLGADVRYFRQFGRQTAIPLGSNGVLDFVRASAGVTLSWPMK